MDKTVAFIRRNSRPLDFLLWEQTQGHPRRAQVLETLAAYQNQDGGFAWAIEPDNFTESSTPMGTWKATTVLRQIDLLRARRTAGCPGRGLPAQHPPAGRLLDATAPALQTMTGTVHQWEKWTGMRFPDSDTYVIPDGPGTLRSDASSDTGTYVEPNVWMQHQ